ncbi:MAG: NADH-quinone oxidoreductase subunit NuoG, partial [Acidimicrobiia bacterium]|nr:NADH-quinone oxidoreductase subunit NuoG [Acidimicrobiia bacterium]
MPDAASASEETEAPVGVPITLDGTELVARPGELLIAAAERLGVYIPRFCYHPRMRPVGMCRMCLVDVDTGRGPALQPSCMLTVSEGMKVDTGSERAKKAQDGVLEFLLINHPLDCPVCDKGGECPLQDQTLSHGPGESRFVEEKRHFSKPIPISSLVFLDRERCILCDRCTRFAKEVAGDPLIHFIDRGAATQVNTFPDEPFSSYFSGNTVEICPVGALTAKPYRFRARPWDLAEVESTCRSCSVGCSITVQSSRDRVLRYMGVDNDATNWGWLCDRGRFGFEAVSSEDRLGEPLVRRGGQLGPARWADALGQAASAVRAALDDGGPGSIGVIGGARLTNESQYAWAKLAKGVIGTDNVDAQLGDGLPPALLLGLPRATIAQACEPGGTVILLGPDPKEQLGALYLRLRHAIVEDGARLVELCHARTGLSHLARASLRAQPGQLAELARGFLEGDEHAELRGDGPVTVVLGRPALTDDPADVAAAAGAIATALPHARFLGALTRGNVFGALDLGLVPGLLPGRVTLEAGRATFDDLWGQVPVAAGLDTAGMLRAAAEGRLAVLVLLGADPLADFPDRALAAAALEGAGTVIAVDLFLTASSSLAHVVLPASGPDEVSGTTTNLEGRVLQVTQKVTAPGTARDDWIIAADLARRLGADLGLESTQDIWAEVRRACAPHAAIEAPGPDGTVAEGSDVT